MRPLSGHRDYTLEASLVMGKHLLLDSSLVYFIATFRLLE